MHKLITVALIVWAETLWAVAVVHESGPLQSRAVGESSFVTGLNARLLTK
jgi:hypothetical protein